MSRPDVICPKCEYVGRPAKKKRGSNMVEFGAWLSFPLGIPYTLWRMLSKYPVCPQCGNTTLIESDSVVGMKLLRKIEEELGGISPAPMVAVSPSSLPVLPKIIQEPRKPSQAPASQKDPNQW